MALSFFTIFVITIVTLVVYLTNQRHHAAATRFVEEQLAIANFGVLGKPDLPSRLRARAIPNRRLIKAFGIVSSFTTEDPRIHGAFLRRATADINKMGLVHCVEFLNAAQLALSRTIAHLGGPCSSSSALPLARLVRTFVLVAILHKFFRVDPASVDVGAAVDAAESINRLWIRSKDQDPEPQQQVCDRALLQAALERLLPGCFPCEPKDHPVNIVIPAYETMWRVVLLTYVAAGFRGEDARQFRKIAGNISEYLGREDSSSTCSQQQQVALDYARVRRN
ncbi:hypothetical protein GGR53DRAFT_479239 [Hypoxylon sp. FL1150]|nr:hypothetical protein GGR53DRAFT_479239 [Hypoxylon sp. FL1150]